jgi:hypothetical protein
MATKQAAPDFAAIFTTLRETLAAQTKKLVVKTDKPNQYTLVTKTPSPFKQHKGQPMWFGEIKIGKAYVSLHLLALYMNPELNTAVSPELNKRKQGKACFNFKIMPDRKLLTDLSKLTRASVKVYADRKWL